jgi:hypothetical protein
MEHGEPEHGHEGARRFIVVGRVDESVSPIDDRDRRGSIPIRDHTKLGWIRPDFPWGTSAAAGDFR